MRRGLNGLVRQVQHVLGTTSSMGIYSCSGGVVVTW